MEKGICYKMYHTHRGDAQIEVQEGLIKLLKDGWVIVSSAYSGDGHTQYILKRIVI